MPSEVLGPTELTRRILAHASVMGDAPDGVLPIGGTSDGIALAILGASERVCQSLYRTLGSSGFNALLTRALAQAEVDHPLLAEIRVRVNSKHILGDMTSLVRTHGAPAVAAALEETLEKMFTVLGRLIGDDMVARLVDHGSPTNTHDEGDER
ncbi:MAG: hypothetical protein ABI625_08200 [bacterium]